MRARSAELLSEFEARRNLSRVPAWRQFGRVDGVRFRNQLVSNDVDAHYWRAGMEERNNNNNDDDVDDGDDDVEGQIEGYNGPSSSSSTQGTSSKGRHQRKDGDDQLDEDDFERILSRSTARRLLSLFEGRDLRDTCLPQAHIRPSDN